jgi:hypothetical protein
LQGSFSRLGVSSHADVFASSRNLSDGPDRSRQDRPGLELARVLPCDLISVDSALVYRGMDIGTAKPERAVLDEFPHA